MDDRSYSDKRRDNIAIDGKTMRSTASSESLDMLFINGAIVTIACLRTAYKSNKWSKVVHIIFGKAC